MEFNDNRPIYKQIIDYCYARIMSGEWAPESRIPSTKDLSVTLAVNNRTVLKAYDDMHALGVIYQKRGLGYFVTAGAGSIILESRRHDFFTEVLPEMARQMEMLRLKASDVLPYLPQD